MRKCFGNKILLSFFVVAVCVHGQNTEILPAEITVLQESQIDSTDVGEIVPDFAVRDVDFNEISI